MTFLPPPAGFAGQEWERYGDPDYLRTLSPPEERVQAAREEEALADRLAAEAAERDAWFGFAGGRLVARSALLPGAAGPGAAMAALP